MPKYIYPPRPSSAIRPIDLPVLEQTGKYLVQRKFNGKRAVISVNKKDSFVFIGNRHRKWYSSSKFTRIKHELLKLDVPDEEVYFDGELLGKDILVLFDILKKNKILFGVSQRKRLDLLFKICRNPAEHCSECLNGIPLALQITDHLWLAEDWNSDFLTRCAEISEHKWIEGVVLRESESVLDNCGTSEYVVPWQVKCRIS